MARIGLDYSSVPLNVDAVRVGRRAQRCVPRPEASVEIKSSPPEKKKGWPRIGKTDTRGRAGLNALMLLPLPSPVVTPKDRIMPAYFIVQATINDEPKFQKYREAVVPFYRRIWRKARRGTRKSRSA